MAGAIVGSPTASRLILLGGEDVPLEQRRRNREDIGNVVEPVVRLIGRQQRSRVGIEREQVANRVGILDLVQAMIRRAPRIRMRRGLSIELALQPRREAVERRLVGPTPPGRGHRAAADFQHHLFPQFRAGTDMLDVGLVEHEPGRFQFFVVAGDAVFGEERPRGG